MSRFLPGTDLSKYERDSLTGGRPRLKEEYRGGERKTSQGAADFLNERGIKPDDKAGLTRAMIEYDRSNRGGGKRQWWKEPRKEYRPEKSDRERRMEMLSCGTVTGGSS